ncbi:MAG: response regulator [Oligoflexus sp.]
MMRPIHLVLIDDELLMGPLFEGIFNREMNAGTVNLHFFSSPQSGLEYLLEMKKVPELVIITDIHMPDMSGFELLRRLRENKVRARTFVVTAYEDVEYRREMDALQIEACFKKPLDFDDLKTHVLNTMQKQSV